MLKVGIPRALSYYRYFPFWKKLLEGMDAEVVVSRPTGKRLIEEGSRHCVDDICIPVKLYYGHVLDLKDRVDRLFISRMVSVEKSHGETYTCPKLIGLPDMIKHSFDDLPPIMDFVVDVQNSSLKKSARRLSGQMNASAGSTKKALGAALEAERKYNAELLRGFDPETAIKRVLEGPAEENECSRGGESFTDKKRNYDLNIALVGHEYLIHDTFISHDLPRRLERLGANVTLMSEVPTEVINRELARYPEISWSYEKELLGAASYFLSRDDIDGVMLVMGFACGPDSIIGEIINREVRQESSPPFTTLVLDEHTGEAGVTTRVEAFVDLIRRSHSRT